MKKLAILIGLMFFVFQAQAGEHSFGLAGGSVMTVASTMWSADFAWRPGKKTVWGISMGDSKFSGYAADISNVAPVDLEVKDLTLFIGYWSNRNKEKFFGWHALLGVGIRFLDFFSEEFILKSDREVGAKAVLGVDFYLIRNLQKYSLALTFDCVSVNAIWDLQNKFTSEKISAVQGIGATQVGLRLWW